MYFSPVPAPSRPFAGYIRLGKIQHFQQSVIVRENSLIFRHFPQLPIKGNTAQSRQAGFVRYCLKPVQDMQPVFCAFIFADIHSEHVLFAVHINAYYVEESHPAIIPPEEFELVQAEYLRRKRLGRKYNSKCIFTARLICECCGGYYGSKVWHSTSKYRRVIWQCNHKFQNGEKCTTPHLYEEHIKDKFILAMNQILENKDEIIENCLLLSENFTVSDDTAIEAVTQEMDVVAELTRNLIQQNSVKPMKQELYKSEYEKLVQRYESLKAKRDALVSKKEARENKLKFILHYTETLCGQDAITEFSEDLWLKAVDHVTICRDGRMVFLFKDGSEITV